MPFTCPAGVAFNLKSPRLRDVSLTEVEKSQEFMRLAVNEGFLKAIGKGEEGSAVVQLMCSKVLAVAEPAQVESSIMKIAVEELSTIANALLALCDAKQTPTDAGIAALGVLRAAQGLQSPAALVKHCVSQTPYWATRDRKLREACAAWKMYKPEIVAAQKQVSELKDDLSPLVSLSARTVAWREALDEG